MYSIETNDQRAGWVVETNESDDRGNRVCLYLLISVCSRYIHGSHCLLLHLD